MARPREFDTDRVLDDAIDLFWRKGYYATSMADLVAATGLHRGSLYAAFGSKAELYERAVDRYIAAVKLRRALADSRDVPVRDLVRSVLEEVIEAAVADEERRGCLMTNAAVELAAHEPRIAERVGAAVGELEALLAERIGEAQRAGEIRGAQSPLALARFVMGTIQGLRVMGKLRPDRRALWDFAAVALDCLAPPPADA